MGCGASAPVPAAQSLPSQHVNKRPAPSGKPLEDWDTEEVAYWFLKLPANLHAHAAELSQDDGCVLANVWSAPYLVRRGVSEDDAARLLAYRDKALKATASAAPAAAQPPPEPAALGVQDTGTKMPFQAPAGASSSSAAATVTLTRTLVTTKQEAEGAPVLAVAAPAVETRSRKEALTAVARKGLKVLRAVLERVGPSLPFGGSEAANLVLQVLDAVEGAMANSDNLKALCDRTLSVLDILCAYSGELGQLQRCRAVVGRFHDHLLAILSYARAYTSRNCLLRLLTAGGDAEQYQGLAEELGRLGEELMLLLASDSNARLQAVQAEMEESLALLKRAAAYKDPAEDARALVEEYGGINAVMADGTKMGAVLQKMDCSARMTIEVVSSLLKSHLDNGPQRHIRQPELRLLWATHFGCEAEVPWFAFWDAFPKLLAEVPGVAFDIAAVEELGRLLADESARGAFQRAVERTNRDTVSVWELKLSFPDDDALPAQVARLVGATAGMLAVAAAAAASVSASPPAEAEASPSAAAPKPSSAVRCQLPPLPPAYAGRDGEAAGIVEHLITAGGGGSSRGGGSSLLLLADGGMGKSCLAADVGWRLLREGRLPGGALWVDLREASSAAEVEARFCASLDVKPDKSDNIPRILAALQRLELAAKDGGARAADADAAGAVRLLVVVDNAEDALGQAEAAETLRTLLEKVTGGIPVVRLLVTSRRQLARLPAASSSAASSAPLPGLAEWTVGAIHRDDAVRLVRTLAPDVSELQAAQVAAACQCVPLVLRLTADALTSGRLGLEELESLLQRQNVKDAANGGGGAGSSAASLVCVVLASLDRAQQQAAAQLSVLPSGFNEESAAAVLGATGPGQAHALLASLYRHSVLQRADSSTGQHVMHMLVRQEAGQLAPESRQQAATRFVQLVFTRLAEWADMFDLSAKEWMLVLPAAREEAVHITAALELLATVPDPAAVCRVASFRVPSFLDGVLGILARFEASFEGLCQRVLAMSDERSAEPSVQQQQQQQQQQEAATALDMHSQACRSGGHYQRALDLAQSCVELRQRVLGAEHPDTLAAINNLAGCFNLQGQHAKAEPLFRRALELRQRVLGAEHPDTICSMNNLAGCIHDHGRYAEAERLYRQALELQQRVLGAEHPNTATSVHNVANCLLTQQRYAEAERLYLQWASAC